MNEWDTGYPWSVLSFVSHIMGISMEYLHIPLGSISNHLFAINNRSSGICRSLPSHICCFSYNFFSLLSTFIYADAFNHHCNLQKIEWTSVRDGMRGYIPVFFTIALYTRCWIAVIEIIHFIQMFPYSYNLFPTKTNHFHSQHYFFHFVVKSFLQDYGFNADECIPAF